MIFKHIQHYLDSNTTTMTLNASYKKLLQHYKKKAHHEAYLNLIKAFLNNNVISRGLIIE